MEFEPKLKDITKSVRNIQNRRLQFKLNKPQETSASNSRPLVINSLAGDDKTLKISSTLDSSLGYKPSMSTAKQTLKTTGNYLPRQMPNETAEVFIKYYPTESQNKSRNMYIDGNYEACVNIQTDENLMSRISELNEQEEEKVQWQPSRDSFSIHSGLGGKGFNHLSLIKDTSNDNFEFSQDGYHFNKKVAKSPPKRTKTIIRFKPDKQASRSEFDDITDPNVQSHHFTHPVVKHTEARRINNRNEGKPCWLFQCFKTIITCNCLLIKRKTVPIHEVTKTTKKQKRPEILRRLSPLRKDTLKYKEESVQSDQVKFPQNKDAEEHLEMELDCNIHEVDIIRTKKTSFKLTVPILRKHTRENFTEGPCDWKESYRSSGNRSNSPKFCNPDSDSDDWGFIEPTMKERGEDCTTFEKDLSVNVAPSRISTYQSKKMIPGTKNWSERLDTILLGAYDQFPSNWKKISNELGQKKTPDECRERYTALKLCNVKGRFTKEEDEKIIKGVEKYGKSWAIIAKQFINRTSKQIRDRYMKTILKRNQFFTSKQVDHQFTIDEKDEEQSEITSRKVDREGVQITVDSFKKESEKRLQGLLSESNQSPLLKSRVLRKQTDNSIFTEESLKDYLGDSDKVWYENLNKTKEKQCETVGFNQGTYKCSDEDWKDKMSVSSASNNAEKLFAKATLHLSPEKLPQANQQSIFKSKETFQDKWHK
ncbi:unnamed protein product [Moneuplotes crassus]|uniref:Uncharacterized protein n=2 Tax=Euplotes crassus TaxID=5936 RepID=A0AAD2D5L4_EUPCR|nr:unnamed protein product [Moneuplotes crassus]